MNAHTARKVIWVWILLVLTACSSWSIQVARVEPTEQHLRTETLDLRNCDTASVIDQSLDEYVTVEPLIQIAEEATVKATGEVILIPEEMKSKIKAEIGRIYRDNYEAALSKVSESRVYVPIDRVRTYTLNWKEQRYSGEAAFQIENQPCRTEYSYTLSIPELGEFKEIACTG